MSTNRRHSFMYQQKILNSRKKTGLFFRCFLQEYFIDWQKHVA